LPGHFLAATLRLLSAAFPVAAAAAAPTTVAGLDLAELATLARLGLATAPRLWVLLRLTLRSRV